ncbi:MAG: phosphoenolpyruvate--protein phosphotransferase [Acidimicrobiales bacterium]
MAKRSPDRVLTGVATSPGAAAGPVVPLPVQVGALPEGVVVADDLSPADVLALDPRVVVAVATAAGAPLSHAAILARSLGIPVVTGLGPAALALPAGTFVLVDGDAGTVHVDPPHALVEEAEARRRADGRRSDDARRRTTEPACTLDGQAIPVLANVGSPQEAQAAVLEGADGVGMLRTEFAFLGRPEPPGEQDQYDAYLGVADAVGDRRLVVRTLDLGADIPTWGGAVEPNPALGNRGLRFALSRPQLLETQLRAISRLAERRPLQVMFPMVTTVDELREARACLDSVTTAPPGAIEIGITVEVPAAALTAEAFAPLVDFFAVGTNDLTQYTLAVDRGNAAVAGLADGLHPGVLRLVRAVTAAGEAHRRPVEVVGELGCDRLAVPVLLGLGVSALSVRPNAVATVKQVVRGVRLDEARRLAEAALQLGSAAAVRRLCAAGEER